MQETYYQTVAETLETLHKDRGLKFTSVFEGLVPVQAYGFIDNARFYYRNREGNISLTVGRHNPFLEDHMFFGMTENVIPNEEVTTVTTDIRADLIKSFSDLVNKTPVHSDEKFSERSLHTATKNYENQVALVETLKELLHATATTPQTVADRIGVTEEVLLEYTTYMADLSLSELRMLATSLGVQIEYNIKTA